MATLEKRITALESRASTTAQRVLEQMPKEDGTYEAVPDGFHGKVVQVVFVDAPQSEIL